MIVSGLDEVCICLDLGQIEDFLKLDLDSPNFSSGLLFPWRNTLDNYISPFSLFCG